MYIKFCQNCSIVNVSERASSCVSSTNGEHNDVYPLIDMVVIIPFSVMWRVSSGLPNLRLIPRLLIGKMSVICTLECTDNTQVLEEL